MGQPKRRLGEIKQLNRDNARATSLVAIHEAGHVAGRFLTAELMGHDPAIAVDFVEMHRRDDASKTPGMGDPCQIPESTTCGPMFSRAIEAVSAVVAARHGIVADGAARLLDAEFYQRQVIAAARNSGANIDHWAIAKITQAIAGPAAEARVRHLSFWQVIDEPTCASDLDEVLRVSRVAGWSEERLGDCIGNSSEWLYDAWSYRPAWKALVAVANFLPHEGRAEGNDCWNVYSSALAQGHTTSMLVAA